MLKLRTSSQASGNYTQKSQPWLSSQNSHRQLHTASRYQNTEENKAKAEQGQQIKQEYMKPRVRLHINRQGGDSIHSKSRRNIQSVELNSDRKNTKSCSPNYNDIKIKRFLRDQSRSSRNKSTRNDQTQKTICQQTITTSQRLIQNNNSHKCLDKYIDEMQHAGQFTEQVLEQHISQLQKMLDFMKKKQRTSQVATTTKKNRLIDSQTRQLLSQQSQTIQPIQGSVKRSLQFVDHAKRQQNVTISESSLRNTQQVRLPKRQIQWGPLSQSQRAKHRHPINLLCQSERSKDTSQQTKQSKPSKINSNLKRLLRPEQSEEPQKLRHPALQHVIEQEESKAQISNYSSPLQLQKSNIRGDLIRLDISSICKKIDESLDSSSNLFENQAIMQPSTIESAASRPHQLKIRKAPLGLQRKIKKNFPQGFFN